MKFQFMDKNYDFLDLDWNEVTGLVDNPNPKSDFEQSTKLDCNPDWTIQQSNPAIPCWYVSNVDGSEVTLSNYSFQFQFQI